MTSLAPAADALQVKNNIRRGCEIAVALAQLRRDRNAPRQSVARPAAAAAKSAALPKAEATDGEFVSIGGTVADITARLSHKSLERALSCSHAAQDDDARQELRRHHAVLWRRGAQCGRERRATGSIHHAAVTDRWRRLVGAGRTGPQRHRHRTHRVAWSLSHAHRTQRTCCGCHSSAVRPSAPRWARTDCRLPVSATWPSTTT